MTNWKDALCDVRKAYRVAAAYQARVAKTVETIAAEFPGHRYYFWDAVQIESLLLRRVSPLDRSPWDGLPLQHFSVFYLPLGADPNDIKKGQCMIEISIETDEVFDHSDADYHDRDGYTDPAKLEPAANSRSLISIAVWRAESDLPKDTNWYRSLWCLHDRPESGCEEKMESIDGSVFVKRWPLEDVFAAPDVAAIATEFKREFALKTGIAL